MAAPSAPLLRRGRSLRPLIVVAVVVAVVAGAVLVRGYDARDIPPLETAVWVTRANGQYARVNTELAAIDTVRAVSDPVGIVQSGSSAMILSQGYSQAWPIDPAYPTDLDEGNGGGPSPSQTPAGTTSVQSAGAYVVYLTSLGEVHLGTYPTPGASATGARHLDPFAHADEDEEQRYVASAVALDASGLVVMYSAQEQAVRRYDATRGAFLGDPEPVPAAPDADAALSLVDGRWVLYAASDGQLWFQGADAPLVIGAEAGSVLQANASTDGTVYVADGAGLIAVTLADGAAVRVAQASGTPAAPITVDGVAYAAWLSQAQASLWSSSSPAPATLALPGGALDDVQNVRPVFHTNGARAVLSEVSTGLVWTVPDGTLVPLEDWDPLEDAEEEQGTVEVDDVVEQEPPVAVDDAFGVRSGAHVRLPLLYNDHDPNRKDVLSIVPELLGEWDVPGFGTLDLTDNDQAAVATITAESGSATFSYAVTDGVSTSAPASVTVTVVPADQNSAPVWCGVDECVQPWPTPEITPGGFVEVPVLEGWVDPESDVIALMDAIVSDTAAPLSVVTTAEGTIAIRHLDPNASAGTVEIDVVVGDAYGATATKTLTLRVSAAPALTAPPIVLTAGVGDPRRVAIADHVTGGSGTYRLIDAVVTQGEESFTVTPVSANGTIELLASQPGQYLATYTVEDSVTLAQQTATLRLTVADSARALTIPPLTAFVRPLEDATIDVLAAVQNTSGRVLLLSAATSSEPNLSPSIVAETYLRVRGSTDTGEPGRIGVVDVVVSDGAGGTASGQVTVFLLPPNANVRPIAVPDAVSVRAGTQVDISVLANDVRPQGEQILLHPDVIGSGAPDEIAFASGAQLRYVAPSEPGVHTLQYSTYLESNPNRFDTATVTVTVVPQGANRAPEPQTLIGRVVAGQTVRIPFTRTGVDPDGDDVALVNVSTLAPGLGVASISAAGGAILYTAPAGGVPGGQVSFTYTVKDARGLTGEAEVRIGVLPTEVADVAPVTYSDYVGAQVGSRTPVTVTPLDNDRDPLRGTLRLVSIKPNAPEGTPEHERLAALIDSATSLEDGRVVLRGGDVLGTHSYVYTVESSTSLSTAEGLIVVGVSDELGPSTLTVTDTFLTARTRADLFDGVDVVSGKVRWQTGDPSTLELAVWGPLANTYSVDGWKISGPATDDRAIVPFTLTGTDFAGNEVQTWGFLRIPAFEDMRLQAVPGLTPIQVGEEQSVAVSVADVLDLPPGQAVELRREGPFPVQRVNARCTPTGDGVVTYAAGREAPWTDTCAIAVRLPGQETWSTVGIPLSIIPKDPQAILNPVSRTISPGATETIVLKDAMVTWEGGRVGDIAGMRLETSYTGTNFIVTNADGIVTAQAVANAKPGVRERIDVFSPDYGGLSASITLVVGIARPDAPRGATFTHQCDVSRGSSCTITAVGIAGEYDPFAGIQGGGLTIASVGTTGSVSCSVATVTQSSPTTLVATWPGGPRPVGGECIVPFTVVDAQGRTGPAQLTLDVLGYPQTPASVTTVAYTGDSVTLQVALGAAVDAHPAVSSVAIYKGGSSVPASCAASGPGQHRCVISGLVNGDRATYTARAVNSVGESLDTTGHETWAYQAPVITSLTATSPYVPGTTTTASGAVEVTVESSDDTLSFQVVNSGATFPRTGPSTTFTASLPVGATVLQVTPISKFSPPIAGGNSGAVATFPLTVIGAPFFLGSTTATPTGTTITVDGVALMANSSPMPLTEIFVAWVSGGATPSCTMNGAGEAQVAGVGIVQSATTDIAGLDPNTWYSVAVCGSNGYGAVLSPVATAFTWVPPAAPTGDLTYKVSEIATTYGTSMVHELESGPSVDPLPGFGVYYWYAGVAVSSTFDPGFIPGVSYTVAYCLPDNPSLCGPAAAITPQPDSAPNLVRIDFPAGCVAAPTADQVTVTGAGPEHYEIIANPTGWVVNFLAGPYQSLGGHGMAATICDPEPDPEPGPDDEE